MSLLLILAFLIANFAIGDSIAKTGSEFNILAQPVFAQDNEVDSSPPQEVWAQTNAMPSILLTYEPIDFGSVNIGDYKEEWVSIYNVGTATLTINSVTRTSGSSDFSSPIYGYTPFDIEPDSEDLFPILFDPSSEGLKSATFTINSNDPYQPEATFDVLGHGISPNKPSNLSPTDGAPDVSLTPTLESSAFLDPDIHVNSQWQLTEAFGDYFSPTFDSDTDTLNLASITISSGTLNYATTYYWRVRYQDVHGTWSDWSKETSFATRPAPDTTPPAIVTDLSITKTSVTAITLTWTAPGDDGNLGTASEYDIRYSGSPITDVSWGLATQCVAEPKPQRAGSPESCIVINLSPDTTYYFASKTADEVPNLSGLSNVVSATTKVQVPVPPEEWTQTYGGTNVDVARSVQQTSDGGYIVAGTTYESFGGGKSDFYLVKTDSKGVEQWSGTYGGANLDRAYSVQETSDGGYIVAGSTEIFGSGKRDFFLVRTDSEGIEQWSRTYGGANLDEAHSVRQTSDGGYILAGSTESFGAGRSDFYLVKTDSKGVEQWSRTFGGSGHDIAYSIQQTPDGGYIVAGATTSLGPGEWDFYVVKTDSQGYEKWSVNYGEGIDSQAYSVDQTSDGGYIIAGLTRFVEDDHRYLHLVRMDFQGEVQWSRTYDEIPLNNHVASGFASVQQTLDGGYIIVVQGGPGFVVSYLVRVDSYGSEKWNKAFSHRGEMFAVQQTSDRGYIVAGAAYYRKEEQSTVRLYYYDFYLVKLAPEATSSISPGSASLPSEKLRRPPYVNFYAQKTAIAIGEEIILSLCALNPITSPGDMMAELTLAIPSEWSVTTSGFSRAGVEGIWTGSYEIKQGANLRTIYVHVRPDKPSQKTISASVKYYFTKQPELKYHTGKRLQVSVYPPGEKPYIDLYAPKTGVNIGEDVILYLSVTNPQGSPGTLVTDLSMMFLFKDASRWKIAPSSKFYQESVWKNTYRVNQGIDHQVEEVHLRAQEAWTSKILITMEYRFLEHPEVKYRKHKVFSISSYPFYPSDTKTFAPVPGTKPNRPYIDLHAPKTNVGVGEEIILNLSALNPITSPGDMMAELTLVVPSGWSVTTSGFSYAGAGGLWTASYEIEQGANLRQIYVHILANEPSEQNIFAYIDYYFSEQPELKHHTDKELGVTVHPGSSPPIGPDASPGSLNVWLIIGPVLGAISGMLGIIFYILRTRSGYR